MLDWMVPFHDTPHQVLDLMNWKASNTKEQFIEFLKNEFQIPIFYLIYISHIIQSLQYVTLESEKRPVQQVKA